MFSKNVRPHLDYCLSAVGPYMVQDFKALEKVQRRATKLVRGIKHLSYQERLAVHTADPEHGGTTAKRRTNRNLQNTDRESCHRPRPFLREEPGHKNPRTSTKAEETEFKESTARPVLLKQSDNWGIPRQINHPWCPHSDFDQIWWEGLSSMPKTLVAVLDRWGQ